jgi:hypothetical protein
MKARSSGRAAGTGAEGAEEAPARRAAGIRVGATCSVRRELACGGSDRAGSGGVDGRDGLGRAVEEAERGFFRFLGTILPGPRNEGRMRHYYEL